MFNLDQIWGVFVLGGPVVAVLICVSVMTLSVVLYKIVQFRAARVGHHTAIRVALSQWDQGHAQQAGQALGTSKSYLAPVVSQAMHAAHRTDAAPRLEAEAEAKFLKLERGFRLLDTVAQLAPLLGLFGTVLGMIEAFQALQDAGSSVDPSLLAGGIWVALLTTAVGLAVAMPTSVILSWFEARMTAERVFTELALTTILSPDVETSLQRQQANVA